MAGENDDEDMADLFSFGSGEFGMESLEGSDSPRGNPPPTNLPSAPAVSAAPFRSNSDDEFLDLLEDAPDLLSGPALATADHSHSHDAETQEILAWLDEEKPTVVETRKEEAKKETADAAASSTTEAASSSSPAKPTVAAAPAPPPPPTETVVALPPVFKDLTSALASSQSTVGQIRRLAAEQLDDITHANRPDLFCRLLTGKSLNATQTQSSLVDAFTSWQTSEARKDEIAPRWMQFTCESLAERVAESLEKTQATHRDKEDCRQDLLDVLQYHERGLPKSDEEESIRDWFIPPVAAALLGYSIPAPVASVLLSQIIGQHMPVLALQSTERWEAAKGLHQHLYWLACYHLPLLVFHLDRYWPGWCAPRIPENKENESEEGPTAQARNVDERGLVPPSWLVSLLAGDVSFLPVSWMGQVWDWILTSPSRSVSFFLTLAVLERAADNLILLTGDELHKGLIKAFEFDDDSDWLGDWWETAKVLQTATPVSVLEQLQKAEDEAVQQAVLRRQERAEAALKARLAAERQAHIEEQERKAEEARARLNRARLVAFYRTHAPDKEGNIDKILETYSDKLEVLEAKLFKKYGESFNPSLKEKKKEEKITRAPNKLLATMSARRNVSNKEEEEAFPTDQIEAPAASKTDQVAVLVKAEEVLPVVCWSKEAAAIRGANRRAHITNSSGVPLKFFLVDSRSEEAAAEQGRFPTAVSLSPETMLDPEKLQKAEEQFESLRGAVHVVVMGEGFSAIPKLYSQKLSSTLEEAMKQDDSRTNICALFFFKKGFPFVSILDGGFAAAHSWLVREGESHHLDAVSALIDYNPESSVFGQMEKLHTASATEKASRAMQNLMEKSLVAMTLQARQLEKLASDMESGRGRFGMSFLTRAKSQSAKTEDSAGNDENKGPRFVNPFANKSTESSAGTETSQGHRFSKMFNRQKSSEKLADSLGGEAESATVGVVPFRNPFARKQESEGEKSADSLGGEAEGGSGGVQFRSPFVRKQDSDTAAKSTTEESSGTENEGAAKPAVVNPFKGLGAAINNSMNRNVENTNADTPADTTTAAATPASSQPSTEDSKTGPASAGDKRNMFGGFGATQAGPPAIPNVLKRNPFRGFSGGAAKKAPEDNSKKTGGFGGGFNSFRTFGRVRPAASKDQDGAGGNDESITFD